MRVRWTGQRNRRERQREELRTNKMEEWGRKMDEIGAEVKNRGSKKNREKEKR